MTSFLHAGDGSDLRFPGEGYAPARPLVESRPSALDWIRGRRLEREGRRVELAHRRAAQRLASLGDEWRILDLKATAGSEPMRFLAVGPGGIFAVTVADHGRARVSFAGDVVQIDGRRPKYVQQARRIAMLVATALSRTTGVSVPVMPVLAFAGSGAISVYGLPKGVIVSSYQELGRVLNARGHRLAPKTVDKLYSLAADPATWINPPYVSRTERYRRYPEGDSSAGRQH
jgi:hypothetical protein